MHAGAGPTTDEPPGSRWGTSDLVALVGAAIVLVTTTVLATRGTSGLEGDLFGAVNGLPDRLEAPVWPVMQLGTVGTAAVIGLAAGLLLRRPVLALIFSLTPLVAWFAARIVKELVGRGRPAAEGLATTIRGTADDGYGFVSGHAAVSFALATVIAAHLPGRWRIVPFALATTVALARLYVGAHLPLDVIGGAALGVVVGEAMRAIEAVALPRRLRAAGESRRDS